MSLRCHSVQPRQRALRDSLPILVLYATYDRLVLAASILPGLRHVRTPLVTGYLYFVAIWLLLGSERLVPQSSGESVWERRLAQLVNIAGPTGTTLALSLAAFLVGSMAVFSRLPWLTRRDAGDPDWLADLRAWADEVSSRIKNDVTYGFLLEHPGLTPAFKRQLRATWQDEYGIERGDGREVIAAHDLTDHMEDPVAPQVLSPALVAAIRSEFSLLTVRLQIERESLWNDYDRLRSESELRYSISVPLFLLVVITATTWHVATLAGLLLPAALLGQAISTERRAHLQVWTAVTHEVIESPTVGLIRGLSKPVEIEPVKEPHRPEFPEPKGTFLEAIAEFIYLWRAPKRARRLARQDQERMIR